MKVEEKTIVSPDMERTKRVPPGQHTTEGWPVLHYGEVPEIKTSEWTLKVWGLVDDEKTLSYDEFQALPRVKVRSDIHCVTTWSKLDNMWDGVSTSVLRDCITIKKDAKFVLVHGWGGFTTNLPIEDFFAEDALFATHHDGEALTKDHGAPVRLVIPRLYFWKSAKWVTGVEFIKEDKPGFWEQNGYHRRGDPWEEERHGW